MTNRFYNPYILSLMTLRKSIENRIDVEIEETMRGRGNHKNLKESLKSMIDESTAIRGRYSEYENIKEDN